MDVLCGRNSDQDCGQSPGSKAFVVDSSSYLPDNTVSVDLLPIGPKDSHQVKNKSLNHNVIVRG
jgi:hypothetical protein